MKSTDISQETKDSIIFDLARGTSSGEVAMKHGVSRSSVVRILGDAREAGQNVGHGGEWPPRFTGFGVANRRHVDRFDDPVERANASLGDNQVQMQHPDYVHRDAFGREVSRSVAARSETGEIRFTDDGQAFRHGADGRG